MKYFNFYKISKLVFLKNESRIKTDDKIVILVLKNDKPNYQNEYSKDQFAFICGYYASRCVYGCF